MLVCDAFLRGKSHQLPYPKSSSCSSFPLELIFSSVWRLVIDSFGNKKYYLSFIDDFSKFTWINLLQHKSNVFCFFKEFQCHVERMFNRKIIFMETDWGDKYESLNSFFMSISISHLVSCLYAHPT
jgi:hypothetical protein